MPTKVYLNLYDLSPANEYLYSIGLGLHHSGVEILGSEYSYASGAGIFEMPPKVAPGARFRTQIEMGAFDGGEALVKAALSELREEFGPDDYNLIRKNCNHFANALCWKIMRKNIPSHVNRLANIGVCCSCLLPREMLQNSPVADQNASRSETSGFAMVPSNQAMIHSSSFSGTGHKLGSSNEEQQGLLSIFKKDERSGSDDLTDRREKVRLAALARMEQQRQANVT